MWGIRWCGYLGVNEGLWDSNWYIGDMVNTIGYRGLLEGILVHRGYIGVGT